MAEIAAAPGPVLKRVALVREDFGFVGRLVCQIREVERRVFRAARGHDMKAVVLRLSPRDRRACGRVESRFPVNRAVPPAPAFYRSFLATG